MNLNISLNEAFHFDPYNPLVVRWFETTDLQPDDAIELAEEHKELQERVDKAESLNADMKFALQHYRALALSDPYRSSDEFTDEYEFTTDSYTLEQYKNEYCPDIDPEGAFVLISDGELLEVWVTENIYWSGSKYERVC